MAIHISQGPKGQFLTQTFIFRKRQWIQDFPDGGGERTYDFGQFLPETSGGSKISQMEGGGRPTQGGGGCANLLFGKIFTKMKAFEPRGRP